MDLTYICLVFSLLFIFLKKCLQAVEVPGQQDGVSYSHTPVPHNLARPSLGIFDVLLHGVPHRHGRKGGKPQTHRHFIKRMCRKIKLLSVVLILFIKVNVVICLKKTQQCFLFLKMTLLLLNMVAIDQIYLSAECAFC